MDSYFNSSNEEEEFVSKFEAIALVFFKLGKDKDLTKSEFKIVDEYLSNLKSISHTDVDIFNIVSNKKYFNRRYQNNRTNNFKDINLIKSNIKQELSKKNITIYEEQISNLEDLSIYLLVKIYELNIFEKNLVDNITTSQPLIVVYSPGRINETECSKQKHINKLKSLPYKQNEVISNHSFLFCPICNSFFIKNTTYQSNISYFNDFSIIFTDKNTITSSENNLKTNKSKIDITPKTIKSDESSDSPVIIVYNNFSSSAKSCLSSRHKLINKPLSINTTDIPSYNINAFFCSICQKYYLKSDIYKQHDKFNFQYNIIVDSNNSKSNNTDIPNPQPKINNKNINIGDFIVRSTLKRCINQEHILSPIKATVSILTSNNVMIEETFDASYCQSCNKSFIFESTYNKLKSLGHICCKVIEYDDLIKNHSDFAEWQSKSLLAMYGYNVNKTQSLSTTQRHKVLDIIIQNNVMKPYEIISHLEMLIKMRKKMNNMSDAIKKWEDDIDYIQHYNKIDSNVRVKSIYAHV